MPQEDAPDPAELACELAGDRFWRNELLRLIGTHPEWPDAAYFLDLGEELAHALVLVLSRVPSSGRRASANAFYAGRSYRAETPPDDPPTRLALGAALVVQALEHDGLAAIADERTLDLLRGAAQRDDLTRTPAPAVDELRKTIARIRFDLANEDRSDPRAAAALALAEVLDPPGDVVQLKEVLARCAWAVVETDGPAAALDFLLEAERVLAEA